MALIRRARGRRTLVQEMERLRVSMPGAVDLQEDRALLWRGFREVVFTFLGTLEGGASDLDLLIRLERGEDVWAEFGATDIDSMLPWLWREYLRPLKERRRVLWALADPNESLVFMPTPAQYAELVAAPPEAGTMAPMTLEANWCVEVMFHAEHFSTLADITQWYLQAQPQPRLLNFTALQAWAAAAEWLAPIKRRKKLAGVEWD